MAAELTMANKKLQLVHAKCACSFIDVMCVVHILHGSSAPCTTELHLAYECAHRGATSSHSYTIRQQTGSKPAPRL